MSIDLKALEEIVEKAVKRALEEARSEDLGLVAEAVKALADYVREGFRTMDKKLSTIDSKISSLDNKTTLLESKVSSLEGKVSSLEGKVTSLEGKVTSLDGRISSLEKGVSKIDRRLRRVERVRDRWPERFRGRVIVVLYCLRYIGDSKKAEEKGVWLTESARELTKIIIS